MSLASLTSSASSHTSCSPQRPREVTIKGPSVLFPLLGAVADRSMGQQAVAARSVGCPGKCLSWQRKEEGSWALLAGTALGSESHHLILLLPGTGTQLHPSAATPIPAAQSILGLLLMP